MLAQRVDGWIFNNKPKTDFLYASLRVLGLTVRLLSSKIIKSYLLSTIFQTGKHTWQYLSIQPLSNVLKEQNTERQLDFIGQNKVLMSLAH